MICYTLILKYQKYQPYIAVVFVSGRVVTAQQSVVVFFPPFALVAIFSNITSIWLNYNRLDILGVLIFRMIFSFASRYLISTYAIYARYLNGWISCNTNIMIYERKYKYIGTNQIIWQWTWWYCCFSSPFYFLYLC